ncbi:hypothetical protein T484DRAFT_1806974 [Baffinella frigidus]|nr:hypothetical protein T484DRAFT_1806974 [Cryptophyta sp. CCMP2293]
MFRSALICGMAATAAAFAPSGSMLPRTNTRGKPPVRVAGRRRDPSLQDTDLPELRAGVGEAWAGRPRGGGKTTGARGDVRGAARAVDDEHLPAFGGLIGYLVYKNPYVKKTERT